MIDRLIAGAPRGFGARSSGTHCVAATRSWRLRETRTRCGTPKSAGERVFLPARDVTNAELVKRVVADAETRTGGVDAVFDNAGIVEKFDDAVRADIAARESVSGGAYQSQSP